MQNIKSSVIWKHMMLELFLELLALFWAVSERSQSITGCMNSVHCIEKHYQIYHLFTI